MSTKIYEGFKFNQRSLKDVFRNLKQLQSTMQTIARMELNTVIAEEAISRFDKICFTDDVNVKPDQSIMGETLRHVMEEQQRAKQGYRTNVDFECTVMVFPIKGMFLGLPFCESNAMKCFLEAQRWYTPFPYWNNSDPEEGCSEKEWTERRTAWDQALPGSGIPSLNGFSFTLCLNSCVQHDKELILRIQPSLEQRAKNLAEDVLLKQYIKELGITEPDSGTLLEFRHWKKVGGPGRLRYLDLIAEVLPKLKPVTWENLTKIAK
jgi:hypothetical protein